MKYAIWGVVLLVASVIGCGDDTSSPTEDGGGDDVAADADAEAGPDADADGDVEVGPDAEADGEGETDADRDADGDVEAGPDAEADGDAADVPAGCTTNADCLGTEYCRKASCAAATGNCVARPVTCDNTGTPTCGCDLVNYWNDCLREQSGIAAATAGTCAGEAASCGGFFGTPCPTAGATCSYLFADAAPCAMFDPTGVCWVVPADCPAVMTGGTLRPCGNRTGPCLDLCRAIQTETSYFDDHSCPV